MVAVVTALGLVTGGSAAVAATGGLVDDSGYSEAEKLAAEQKAATQTAERTCDLLNTDLFGGVMRERCVEAISSQFTRSAMPALAGAAVCNALTGPVLPLKAACLAVLATQLDDVQGWFWGAYEAALGAAESVGQVISFIADPGSAIEAWANQVKDDAISLFIEAMTSAVQVSSFDATAQWWRSAYAASAGIGLAVLAVMFLLTWRQAATGKIGPEEGARSLLYYLPIGVFMLFMGPPVAWAVQWLADGLSAGIVSWMGPDTVEYLEKAATFTAMTSDIPGGLAMGLVLFGLLFLAGLGVLGTFLIQTISVYLLGAVTGISWGMLVHPLWRPKALRLPLVWVGLVLAKPAMLLVLALVMKMSNAVELAPSTMSDGLTSLINALMVVLALLFVAFAPWTLLKWFPLLPDGSESVRSSGPVGLAAGVAAGGAMLTQLAMNRARRDSAAGGPGRAAGHRPTTTPAGAPGGGSTGGTAAAGPGAGGARAGAAGAGARGAGVAGGTAAGAGAAGSGKAAAGAGKAAGAGGSGGALLAAMLVAQAAQAAISKAQQSSNAAAPDMRGGEAQ